MTSDDRVIDLCKHERDGDLSLRLRCTRCHGGTDEAPGGALTKPVRHQSDPESVVRCAECGKKHGRDSLTLVDP